MFEAIIVLVAETLKRYEFEVLFLHTGLAKIKHRN